MAEQKQPGKKRTIVKAEGAAGTKPTIQKAPETGNATGLRIGAIALWVVAVVLEILAVLTLTGNISMSFLPMSSLTQIIVMLVLDLVCVIIGSQLWKKSNHIDPASEKNKVKFWLWNNMGVIACVIAFVPFVILALTNKDADAKTKKIASIVAIIALLIGGVASYDFNPISEEQKAEAMAELGDTTVYWTPFGKVYHTDVECHAMNRTDTITEGTVEQAIAANRTRLCKYCETRDAEEPGNPEAE
ncbi:MAG: hypothetical protein K2N94_04190 [Lachnospiraceae bacterium]|nr:hypothetical protein [Lachnospiraceae bacterium]